MAKKNLTAITTKIHDFLKPLGSEERQRAIAAALTLLGEHAEGAAPLPPEPSGKQHPPRVGSLEQARRFFDSKQPQTKIEELAVAGRFREQYQSQHSHGKDDFGRVIGAARRNFDSRNFRRDLDNAKKKGLFTKGRDNTLSYYGQQFVDALPDREAVKKLRKPKKMTRKRKGARKKRQ